MPKAISQYHCVECGTLHAKWQGRCEGCGAWDSLQEERLEIAPKSLDKKKKSGTIEFVGLESQTEPLTRICSEITELDRVLGGGLVPGSAILIGGDPGIGKSTLLLQLVAMLGARGVQAAYISGEESVAQIQMRAKRLGLGGEAVQLATANAVRDIIAAVDQPKGPKLVVIDSIQTMFSDMLDAAPGTVSQVRACSNELIKLAKKRGITMVLVGHVTKEGQIAGPRVMEHMVDTVLYFEGDRGHPYRIVRSVKNRFGPTDEIGVFSMTEQGLQPVDNPSSLFLTQRDQPVAGSAVFAGVEGSRQVLVEIQALVAPSSMATPRRAVVGWDSNRLAMILAVLEARAGLRFSDQEVYLNIAGGLRIAEPAADLAVAAALISARTQQPIDGQSIIFGEIGLSGEIRPTSRSDLRMKEAQKLGFTQAILPKKTAKATSDLHCIAVAHIQDLVSSFDHQAVAEVAA